MILSFYTLESTERLYYDEYKTQWQEYNEEELKLINFVRNAIDLSESFKSKIPEDMLFFGDHITSPRSRHLLNNICSLEKARILEIGTYKGASIISALYKNNINYAYSIDNWSEFGGPKDEFFNNIKKYIPNANLIHITADAFSINPDSLPKFNIFFYDGDHSVEAQEKAFLYFNKNFDNVFIAIVDDWMWDQVRIGTFNAFKKLEYKILYEKEVALRYKNDIPWRFLYVAIIKKI